MQLALPSDSKAAYVSRLMIAGVAVAGASLFAMNAPTPTGPQVQHRDVKLAAGEVDWSTVICRRGSQPDGPSKAEAATAKHRPVDGARQRVGRFGTQISTALTGFETGIQNALDGGWYGGDDGYVFGLFGGTVTDPATGISETGSLLQQTFDRFPRRATPTRRSATSTRSHWRRWTTR